MNRRLFPMLALAFVFPSLFFANVFHAGDFSPFLVSSADYWLNEENTIRVSDGKMTDLALNLSIPKDSEFNATGNYNLERDLAGNVYLIVKESSPPSPYTHKLSIYIPSRQEVVTSLDDMAPSMESMAPYLASDNDVPASSPYFISLANQIAADKSTDFEKISSLAQWVHNYITYDLDYADKNMSVMQIMDNKRGVCGDYTLLFVTLSRSLGYPTRFVNGYAYSDVQKEWIGHAWAEVYLGKWISVDPTWLEVGHLDATHVAISRLGSIDRRLASVSARVTPNNAQLFWNNPTSASALSSNLHVISYSLNEPEENFELSSSAQEIPPGSTFLVYLKYDASEYRTIKLLLAPCRGEFGSLLEIENETQVLTTSTGSEQYVIWKGKASDNVANNMIYSCNLTLNSDLFALRSSKIVLSTDKSSTWNAIDATLESSSLPPGSRQKIFAKLPKSMAGRTVYALEEGFMLQKVSDSNGQAEFEFNATRIGSHTIYVFANSAEPKILQYNVSSSFGEGFVSLDIPSRIYENSQANILAHINPEFNPSPDSILTWSWAGQYGRLPLSNLSDEKINISFSSPFAGKFPFTVSLIDGSGNSIYSYSEPLEVFPSAQVWVEGANFSQIGPSQSLLELAVGRKGPVQRMWLVVDGVEYPLSSDSVALTLNNNFNNTKLVWVDSAGQMREAQIILHSPTSAQNSGSALSILVNWAQKSFLGSILPWLVVALVMIAIATLVIARKQKPPASDGL